MAKREMPEAATMQAMPTKEHDWLRGLLGDWTYEGEASMTPDSPPMKFTGTEKVRSLKGLWYIAESEGPMPDGGTANMILTLGYDPNKARYVGTWIGSMMTYLWTYEGSVDPSGTKLTLDSEGPNMAVPGTMARFQDIHEFESADHRIVTSQILGDDGRWQTVMTMHYRKTK